MQIELMNPAAVSAATFAPFSGQGFLFTSGELQLQLTLQEVTGKKERADGQRVPFSVLFIGPSDSSFLQGIGRLSAAGFGELEVFICRVMPPPGSAPNAGPNVNARSTGYYEAVFG